MRQPLKLRNALGLLMAVVASLPAQGAPRADESAVLHAFLARRLAVTHEVPVLALCGPVLRRWNQADARRALLAGRVVSAFDTACLAETSPGVGRTARLEITELSVTGDSAAIAGGTSPAACQQQREFGVLRRRNGEWVVDRWVVEAPRRATGDCIGRTTRRGGGSNRP